ncbi:MAG TPA: M42 family peptidase, partial [Methanomicrobiales archaeon]|nr:M42 family peptidase [Methanomicrobiales archaeon]
MVKSLIRKYSDAHGLSGREGNISDAIRSELESCVDEIHTDSMGNLIAVKKGGDFTVMLAAHMDEIGLMARYIDDDGFIRFSPFGGWYAPTLYSQRVVVHGSRGRLYGVVGAKPPHIMTDEEKKKELKIEDMFIDIGATSREDAEELGVEIGTPITIDREVVEMAHDRMTGKAFDNRVGCALLTRVM